MNKNMLEEHVARARGNVTAAAPPVADADERWVRLKEHVDLALELFNGRIAPGQDADPDNFYKPYPKANQEPLPTTK